MNRESQLVVLSASVTPPYLQVPSIAPGPAPLLGVTPTASLSVNVGEAGTILGIVGGFGLEGFGLVGFGLVGFGLVGFGTVGCGTVGGFPVAESHGQECQEEDAAKLLHGCVYGPGLGQTN